LIGGSALLATAAETTRTLRAELPPGDSERFGVENLAGHMKVTVGSGDGVVAVATVHAERPELADLVRFERVTGSGGRPTLRVRYPLDRHTEYRYPGGNTEGGLLLGLFPGGTTDGKYEDRHVRVGGRRGVLLYADVEVQVPRKKVSALFKMVAGPMDAESLQGGDLRFETNYGAVTISGTSGDVVADTGSGEVEASGVKGSFRCDTGSGNCRVSGFEGTTLVCDTGSGNVRVERASAASISIDSGSGNVTLEDADAEELAVDTGSGNLDVRSPARRLGRIKAETGSGNVRLRLGRSAGFEAHAQLGSGDIENGYADATPILQRREVVGYRRGDGRIRIDVDTGSGDLTLQPID
jgi:hypothetical protein